MDCISLINLTFEKYCQLATIGRHAFENCASLISVNIPDSVTDIDYDAFKNCTSLVSATIPEGVTKIDMGLFSGCKSLVSVTISASIKIVSNGAFLNCSSLTDVYYTGSREDWTQINIDGNNDRFRTATIHYNYNSEE